LAGSFDIVKHISNYLKPGGTLCLIDLDHNCLNHYGIPERLEKTILDCAHLLKGKGDFDFWAGRKLYSFLYDLGYENISVDVSAHHLIYGPSKETDDFNWVKKIQVPLQKIKYDFPEYNGSYEKFSEEFSEYFKTREGLSTPRSSPAGE
jgi:hypothetical protein